jgi:hypothetical protein
LFLHGSFEFSLLRPKLAFSVCCRLFGSASFKVCLLLSFPFRAELGLQLIDLLRRLLGSHSPGFGLSSLPFCALPSSTHLVKLGFHPS